MAEVARMAGTVGNKRGNFVGRVLRPHRTGRDSAFEEDDARQVGIGRRADYSGQRAAVPRRTAALSLARILNYRSDLNAARISDAKISGSSHAAKCPPLSASWK